MSAEDDPGDTIRPRLDAHGADVRRVHLLNSVRKIDEDGPYERLITLADVELIEQALQHLTDCKLIVVDPIGSYLGGQTDAHRDNEVRQVLTPIAKLAEKYGVAVVAVAHRRKGAADHADDLALGSRAFTGIARAVWHVSRDPRNSARRLFLPGKNNLAIEGDGLAFSIDGEPARVHWESTPVTMTANDAVELEASTNHGKRGPQADALHEAMSWLKNVLAKGPRLAKELLEEWTQGLGGSGTTLKRARSDLKVEAFRPKVPGAWWWRLPSKEFIAFDDE